MMTFTHVIMFAAIASASLNSLMDKARLPVVQRVESPVLLHFYQGPVIIVDWYKVQVDWYPVLAD